MKFPTDLEKYARYFSEQNFTDKILNKAKELGVKTVYYALVLKYAMFSEKISKKDRGIIIGALGYLILPVDLLPDFLPALGYTDDLAALTLAILKVMGNITPEVKAMAKARVCEIFKLSGEVEISFPEEGGAMDVDEQ